MVSNCDTKKTHDGLQPDSDTGPFMVVGWLQRPLLSAHYAVFKNTALILRCRHGCGELLTPCTPPSISISIQQNNFGATSLETRLRAHWPPPQGSRESFRALQASIRVVCLASCSEAIRKPATSLVAIELAKRWDELSRSQTLPQQRPPFTQLLPPSQPSKKFGIEVTNGPNTNSPHTRTCTTLAITIKALLQYYTLQLPLSIVIAFLLRTCHRLRFFTTNPAEHLRTLNRHISPPSQCLPNPFSRPMAKPSSTTISPVLPSSNLRHSSPMASTTHPRSLPRSTSQKTSLSPASSTKQRLHTHG